MEIRWTLIALEALDSYISAENQEGAKKIYAQIKQQVKSLSDYPHKGRAGRITGTKELIILNTPYIIPYRVKNKIIEILCVFHSSRKLPSKW